MTNRLDWPEARLDDLLDHTHELGKVAALDSATRLLLKMAGKEFEAGKDGRAKLIRDIAHQVREWADVHRQKFDEMKAEYEKRWEETRPEGEE